MEDFAPLVVQHIPTERETLVSKLLGNNFHCLVFYFIFFFFSIMIKISTNFGENAKQIIQFYKIG